MPSFKVELTERVTVCYYSEIVVDAPTKDVAGEAVSDRLDEVNFHRDWSGGRHDGSDIDIDEVTECQDKPEWKVTAAGLLEEVEPPATESEAE
jgi:hypothetical protein